MSGARIAIVDTGPLYAAVDRRDEAHARSLEVLERIDLRLVVPALVVAEVCALLGRRGGRGESPFLRGLADLDVEAPTPDDYERMAELVEQYADFPLGGVDASVVALAERLDTDVVITLDRRHFGAVRPRHRRTLTLLPE